MNEDCRGEVASRPMQEYSVPSEGGWLALPLHDPLCGPGQAFSVLQICMSLSLKSSGLGNP